MTIPAAFVEGELLPPVPDFLLEPGTFAAFVDWLRLMGLPDQWAAYWLRRRAGWEGRELDRADYLQAGLDPAVWS